MRVDGDEGGGSVPAVDGVRHEVLAETGTDGRNDILVRAEDLLLVYL